MWRPVLLKLATLLTLLGWPVFFQVNDNLNGDESAYKVRYVLNRSRDQGQTWNLAEDLTAPNGVCSEARDAKSGCVVAVAESTQGCKPAGCKEANEFKFGGVNTLLGGVDSLAIDPLLPPCSSSPTRWKVVLPMSMPMDAISMDFAKLPRSRLCRSSEECLLQVAAHPSSPRKTIRRRNGRRLSEQCCCWRNKGRRDHAVSQWPDRW